MGILETLDRCTALEREAEEIYGLLAARFPGDEALRALWHGMAADEREHARKLAIWRALIEKEPANHRPTATGFADAVGAIEAVMRWARVQAAGCRTPDEAFAIALEIETSELDDLSAQLARSSPLVRVSEVARAGRRDSARHHGALVRMVRERSRDEHNRLRAALLAVSDLETTE